MSCAALAGQARASWHPLWHDNHNRGLQNDTTIASEMESAVSTECRVFLDTLKMIGMLFLS